MARIETLVQPGFQSYHEPYMRAVCGMQREWRNISNNSDLYHTHDLKRQQNALDNYYEHLKLDEEFLSSSNNWNRRFRQRELVTQRQAALRTNDKVRDGYLFPQYTKNMNKKELLAMPENDIRENHAWAETQLLGHRGETHPLASAAHKRIVQFSDWLGITDRYTGFRHNLTRTKSDRPEEIANKFIDKHTPQDSKFATEAVRTRQPPRRFHLSEYFDNAKSIGMNDPPGTKSFTPLILPVMTDEEKHIARTYNKNPQEWSGINENYPGESEFKSSFVDHLTRLRDVHTRSYCINPNPDFTLMGKPQIYPDSHYATGKSEYTYHYEWPDGNKVRVEPWAIEKSITKFNPPRRWDR